VSRVTAAEPGRVKTWLDGCGAWLEPRGTRPEEVHIPLEG